MSAQATAQLALRIPAALTTMALESPSAPPPAASGAQPTKAVTAITTTTTTSAPPLARPAPRRAAALTLASYACALLLFAIALSTPSAANTAIVGMIFLFVLYQLLRFVWLYQAWSALPPAHLATSSGALITPGAAVGRHFIPFYNLYWLFAVRSILCDGLSDVSQKAGVSRRPPRDLAILCGVVELLPYVNLFVSPLVTIVFMSRVNEILDRIHASKAP